MRPASALALRSVADARVRTLSFSLLFCGVAAANVVGYRKTYPTLADRLKFAHTFGANTATRLFYGTPHELTTIGGYASWRVGGVLSLFAGFVGALAATRTLRGEEETGRAELVAVGAITRPAILAAKLAAVAAAVVALWFATLIGLAAGRLPVAGSAYLALATVAAAVVYAGVGAVASQLCSTRRGALELAGSVLALDFLLRVVSDTTNHQGLHWIAPLGWVEELQPFADPRPAVLALPAVLAVALFALALALEGRRDLGVGLLAPRDLTLKPGLRLLRSPTLLALRSERISLTAWVIATGGFAFVIGTVSKSVASAGLSANVKQQLHKLGSVQIATPSGYIGLTFLFFVLAVSLFCCGQLAAARSEEAEGRLETLFALPQSRTHWLAGRLALAVCGAVVIALAAGLGAAVGASVAGAHVSWPHLVEAGLNCLPASVLFLGVGALLVATVPRLGVGAAYALVILAFVWELFGALVGVPVWLLAVSPFHQLGLVPAAPFRATSAAGMLALGGAAAAAALVRFRDRDLTGL